jgi:hypothetical protein
MLAVLDAAGAMTDYGPMKTRTPSPGAWPYGLEVETTREGLLLKPRRKPREGWAKAFRSPKSRTDELAKARQVQNKFDAKEWQW